MLQPTIGNPAAVEDRIEQVVGLDPGRAMLRGHRVGDLLDPLQRQRAAATRAATAVSGLQVSRSGDCA